MTNAEKIAAAKEHIRFLRATDWVDISDWDAMLIAGFEAAMAEIERVDGLRIAAEEIDRIHCREWVAERDKLVEALKSIAVYRGDQDVPRDGGSEYDWRMIARKLEDIARKALVALKVFELFREEEK